MARIHALACVDAAASIADDVEIGPFCVVGPHASIGPGCRLLSHVTVAGRTTIGAATTVYPYASLGTAPQSTAYRGEPTELVIGGGCDIREGVTMSIGTAAGGGVTTVGDGGFFMAQAHVAHDCRVGDRVIFANSATLGGHCEVGDHVFIGGLSGVHQHTRIGAHAMIGALSAVRGDIVPFGLASGNHARLFGINIVGMRRRNFSPQVVQAVRKAYRRLFRSPEPLDELVQRLEADAGDEPAVMEIVEFVRARGKRVLCRPQSRRAGSE